MAGRLLPDELWAEIAPLFPVHVQSPLGGRKPVDNRTVFTSVLFMLKTGIGWRDLPTELGASEKTVRRRLKTWNDTGLWNKIFQQLLVKLRAAGRLDLEQILVDGGLIKAPSGGENVGRTQPIAGEVAVS